MTTDSLYRNTNFQIVLGASLIMMMMVSAIVPAFPNIVEAFGLSAQSVGLLITVNTFPAFLFSPLGGIMADKLGKKRLLVFSLLTFGIFGGACALARDFNTLLILRFLQGIGSAPLAGISFAIISDLFSDNKRAEAIGISTTAMYAGYIIYPLLGGALAGLAWNYPFLLFLLSIPLGIIAIFALKFPETPNKQRLRDYVQDAVHYFRSWKVAWLFLASVITYILLFGSYLTYFGLFIEDRFHTTPMVLGIFIAVVGLCTALVSLLQGKISQRVSPVSLIITAFIMYAVAMAIIPIMPGLWLCLLPTIIFGIAHGLNLPSMTLMASRVTLPAHRAGFIAMQNTMILLGMTIAPLIIGLSYTYAGLNFSFIISALLALIIPLMAVIIGRKRLSV